MARPSVQIVAATADHARELAPRLRAGDLAEIQAGEGSTPLSALLFSVKVSVYARALLLDGAVAAIWGVAPLHGLLGATGVVWLLTGDLVERNRKTFLRLCRGELTGMLQLFPVLIQAIDARYTKALRWARWLGFRVADARPLGVAGEPFHPIEARR